MTESKKITLADALQPSPFTSHISKHPYARLIEDHLNSLGVDPAHANRQAAEEAIWTFPTEDRLSVAYRLYKDRKDEPFAHLEVAFARSPEATEDLVLPILLSKNQQAHFPMCFGLNEDRLVVVVFRSYCAGITPQHFLLRLASIIEYARTSRDELLRPQLGLLPLPRSWFKSKAS